MILSLLVAVSENGAIGKDNQLLWRLPDDLKLFKNLTLGHPIIMGRKTFDSIGKPLPGRTSIVVTRNKNLSIEGAIVVNDLAAAIDIAKKLGTDEAFVIGGGELYKVSEPLAQKLYITEVETVIKGDTFFKVSHPENWTETKRVVHPIDDRHAYQFSFVEYVRKQD